jgi:hypothetical protein
LKSVAQSVAPFSAIFPLETGQNLKKKAILRQKSQKTPKTLSPIKKEF